MSKLKTIVESYIRKCLEQKHGKKFEGSEIPLDLITGGVHRFDAVSNDRTIVAGIKSFSVRETGKVGVGVIKSAFTELYFLSLVKAEKKLLIFTNEEFYNLFSKRALGKVLPDTEIVLCPLSDELALEIAVVNENARREIGKIL